MHKDSISMSVIRRLPRYYRFLSELNEQNVERISSTKLAEIMNVTASQVRQDLNCFGGFGQQGYGYSVSQLKEETIRFVHRLGKKHLISIESDRDADYNLYFQMQNQLMEAYSQLRNETAQKKYHRDYALLNNDQKEQVRSICPQRITESYANAMTHADQCVDANAEEKQGAEKAAETATEQQKGGKQ